MSPVYKVRELFVLDKNGKYVSVGFGVFKDGKLIRVFDSVVEAEKYIDVLNDNETANRPRP